MKLMFLTVAFAALTFGQAAAKAEATKAPLPADIPKERLLTIDEITKLVTVNAQIEVLRKRFNMDELEQKAKEFQAELAVIAARQSPVITGACASVGISEEDAKKGMCGLNVGIDAIGKVINGQDGKPLMSRVWAIKPAVTPDGHQAQ